MQLCRHDRALKFHVLAQMAIIYMLLKMASLYKCADTPEH